VKSVRSKSVSKTWIYRAHNVEINLLCASRTSQSCRSIGPNLFYPKGCQMSMKGRIRKKRKVLRMARKNDGVMDDKSDDDTWEVIWSWRSDESGRGLPCKLLAANTLPYKLPYIILLLCSSSFYRLRQGKCYVILLAPGSGTDKKVSSPEWTQKIKKVNYSLCSNDRDESLWPKITNNLSCSFNVGHFVYAIMLTSSSIRLYHTLKRKLKKNYKHICIF